MKVVLIGSGMVADTHLAALRDADGITLSGVMGRRLDNSKNFAEKARSVLGYEVRTYENVDQITSDKADFVLLATPPDARSDLIMELTANGFPILMEKPIERSFNAAQEIADICDASGKPNGVFFQNRTRPAARELKRVIEKGLIGDIVFAEIRVPWWRDQGYYDEPGRGTYARDGGGVLINQAIHTLDLALWTMGPWKTVQATLHKTKLHRMEAEDWAGAVFETSSGAVGTLMATTAAFPGSTESISLVGASGSAQMAEGILTVKMNDGRQMQTGETSQSGGGADPMAFSHEWHQKILEDFRDCLANHVTPIADVRSALQAHAVIDAMERSSETGQRIEVERI